jgi:hypothetical protein
MKNTIVILIIALLPNILPAQQTNFALNVGGTSEEFINDMAVDGNGNTYLIGTIFSQAQSVNFNPLGTASNQTPNDLANTFVAKYNSSGILQWSIVFDNGLPSLNNVWNGQIAVDGNGDVYIAVHLDQTNVDFNPLGTANTISATGDDYILAKYNSSGILQWIFQVDANIGSSRLMDITTDASNNLYVYAPLNGTNVNINPLGTSSTLTGTNDAYIAKYNTNGINQWAFVFSNSSQGEYQPTIQTDNSGNFYIFSNLFGSNVTIDFNPLGTTTSVTNSGNGGFAVAKYNSSGINQWVFNIGLLRGGRGNNLKKLPLVLDSQSNIYIGGEIPLGDVASPTNLNPLGTAVTFADLDAGFIAKYKPVVLVRKKVH